MHGEGKRSFLALILIIVNIDSKARAMPSRCTRVPKCLFYRMHRSCDEEQPIRACRYLFFLPWISVYGKYTEEKWIISVQSYPELSSRLMDYFTVKQTSWAVKILWASYSAGKPFSLVSSVRLTATSSSSQRATPRSTSDTRMKSNYCSRKDNFIVRATGFGSWSSASGLKEFRDFASIF